MTSVILLRSIRFFVVFCRTEVPYFIRNFVMVCDYHCHSKFFCQLNLIRSCNTIITGQNNLHAGIICVTNCRFMKTITICNTMRYELIAFGTKSGQTFVEDICTGHTIHVIVAHDSDVFSCFHCVVDNINATLHISQFRTIRNGCNICFQVFPYSVLSLHTTVSENLNDGRMYTKLFCKYVEFRTFEVFVNPFAFTHFLSLLFFVLVLNIFLRF